MYRAHLGMSTKSDEKQTNFKKKKKKSASFNKGMRVWVSTQCIFVCNLASISLVQVKETTVFLSIPFACMSGQADRMVTMV